ncbi:YjjG family noncanonical pyrimidine nucleotidase [Aestuariibaculum suncheonense]|uniref:Noncanonical pyrimidine nucleotidase, YjjG family n=1 Tax=Aestuariibaculum suncheonense TaxID=1028745 RepID=A0A8J6QAR4_9FLAO|nr:YjjG family noncanonical pyrimidine nucleotidase [Aestuariibaculum suncheonense]MBD0834305.1 noncanonical pyrimidine nucleotidase, YjjG family [Aestuariibaculum suncheonense]
MKINGITDIFFDLDHTLWDFDRNSELAFDKILKLNNVEVDLQEFLTHYKAINLQYWKWYRDEKVDKALMRFGRLKDTFTALNKTVAESIIHQLAEDYITYLTDHNYLFNHTIEVLEYLSDNYNLHILSNGFEEVQTKKLIKSNINHYFKTVTNGESVGVKKPNPRIFHHAIEKANTSIEKSIMIGDGFEADILGAMSIGMDVIYFNEFNQDVEASIKHVNNLLDLKKYL